MKTIKYLSIRVLAITALALVFAMPAKAQLTDNGYANIDWQFNFPLSNHFADKASGWGRWLLCDSEHCSWCLPGLPQQPRILRSSDTSRR